MHFFIPCNVSPKPDNSSHFLRQQSLFISRNISPIPLGIVLILWRCSQTSRASRRFDLFYHVLSTIHTLWATTYYRIADIISDIDMSTPILEGRIKNRYKSIIESTSQMKINFINFINFDENIISENGLWFGLRRAVMKTVHRDFGLWNAIGTL